MKVYLVTQDIDDCGDETKKIFTNKEYAQKYAKLFGYDVKEEEIVEADIVEEHKYYRIEYDLILSANNTVAVIGRHKYPCQWSECNFKSGTWEIVEQGENDVLIAKMTIYVIDNDDPIDHKQIIEDGIKSINWFQRDWRSAGNESRRIQVGDSKSWLRCWFSNEILSF